ncbi:MAG: DUF2118 domain-containing protein [Ignisphaera sp.]
MYPSIYVNKLCLSSIENTIKKLNEYNYRAYGTLDLDTYINEDKYIYVSEDLSFFCNNQYDNYEKYIEIVYEKVMGSVIDFDEKRIVCDMAMLIPKHNKVLHVPKNTHIEIIEISGKRVHPLVDIGSNISRNSKLCYTVTKKYEVRSIKSDIDGVVIYVGEAFLDKEQTIYIIIAEEGKTHELTRCH